MKAKPGKYLAAVVFIVLGALTAFWYAPPPEVSPPPNLVTLPLQTLDGGETSYAELPPKPRVVNFWATWCAPCVHEMPIIDMAAKANPDVHFSGIGIDSPILIKPFLEEIAINYDIYTPKFNIFLLFEQIGNENGVLPYTLLLDENGAIIAKKIGEFHSVEDINNFISENRS
ncbi:MAG: TlpA family protein disulfide reductase [Gammaproteobacteria bacterium WSBS_2016_MAG_OTU1]